MSNVPPVDAPSPSTDTGVAARTEPKIGTAPASPAVTSVSLGESGAVVVDVASKDEVGKESKTDPNNLGFTISKVPRLDITICYKDICSLIKVPIEDPGIKTILTPIIDAGRAIATLGKSLAKRDFYRVDHCTGVIRPGTMTMILGPPGHGKTSFLKAIAARLPLTSGKITFNGRTEDEALAEGCHTDKLTQFVEQVDTHLPLLTVRETLEFAHRVSSAHYDPERVDHTLKLLGLEECADTIVGDALTRGVSGGQKHRVTLGEMLMGDAYALFLDEYTNGLDTATAEDITRALRTWVKSNNSLVVANVQQPTPGLFACYDDIILLRESTVVYHGPTKDVLPYLETMGFQCPQDVDVCDFLMDVLAQPRVAVERHNAKITLLEKRIASSSASAEKKTPTGEDERKDTDGEQKHHPTKGHHRYDSDPGEELQGVIRGPQTRKLSNGVTVQAAALPCVTTAQMVAHWKSTQLYQDLVNTVDYHMDPANRDSLPVLLPDESAHVCYALNYSLPTKDLIPLVFKRQWMLVSRNRNMILPRLGLCLVMGLLQGSLIYQVPVENFVLRVAALLLCVNQVAFGNMVELPISVLTNKIVYKHYAARFYPPWIQVLAFNIIGIPLCLAEILVLTTLVYWMSGCASEAGVFITFLAICLCQSFMLGAWFRFLSATSKTEAQAQAVAAPSTVVFMLFGGFFVTLDNLPVFMRWIFWISPFSWSVRALGNNEFLSSRYSTPIAGQTMGEVFLQQLDMKIGKQWIGYGVIYLIALSILLLLLHSWVLLDRYRETTIGTRRFDDEPDAEDAPEDENETKEPELPRVLSISLVRSRSLSKIMPVSTSGAIEMQSFSRSVQQSAGTSGTSAVAESSFGSPHGGLSVLRNAVPFTPVWVSFSNVKYTVPVTVDGKPGERLLLDNINGYAEPGKLTALMGASGAGKTTLLDVLANRKNVGTIEGTILFNGVVPTVHDYARFTGYVEQFDSLLPFDTVRETLLFAAQLRLPASVDDSTKEKIVDEVVEILDLTPIANMIIGSPAFPSLSPSQLKRVNIGCELVANPSVLFVDEPTTGLDSRSAQTVMRVVRRIARAAGRSVICTIHQPSAELFYYFDRLVLLATGGHQMYFGDLGSRARTFIRYLSAVPRVRPIKPNYNPATWMLEEVGVGVAAMKEAQIGDEGSHETPAQLVQRLKTYYFSSPTWRKMKETIDALEELQNNDTDVDKEHADHVEMSVYLSHHTDSEAPEPDMRTSFVSTTIAPLPDHASLVTDWVDPTPMAQLKLVILRAFRAYYRNSRLIFIRARIVTILSIVFGLIYLDLEIKSQSSVLSKIAAIQITAMFGSVVHGATAIPVMMENRATFYRERASGMYKPWMWTLSQLVVELVFNIVTSMLVCIPAYFMVGLLKSAEHFFKFWFATYFLCTIYVTMSLLISSIAKTAPLAGVMQGLYLGFFLTFGGIAITTPNIPRGYMWLYRMLPISHLTEALVMPQFHTCPDFLQCGPHIPVVVNNSIVVIPANQWLVQYLGFGVNNYWSELGWATIFLFSALLVAFFCTTKFVFVSR